MGSLTIESFVQKLLEENVAGFALWLFFSEMTTVWGYAFFRLSIGASDAPISVPFLIWYGLFCYLGGRNRMRKVAAKKSMPWEPMAFDYVAAFIVYLGLVFLGIIGILAIGPTTNKVEFMDVVGCVFCVVMALVGVSLSWRIAKKEWVKSFP
ncbi:hypothetical protein [Caulobacter sp. CCG-8]|uniref:hypothetical protein n=1 Tax=Caulobacter sp. CCG-8 TaxID=3127958 RepID=UPI00307EF413